MEQAGQLTLPEGVFIDGALRATDDTIPCTTPRDGTLLTDVAAAGPADVDAAVAAARRAFDQGPWPRLKPRERGARQL